MKNILITTIAAVVLVGCGELQQTVPQAEAKPEPPTAKVPDISIHEAAEGGNLEAVKQHLAAGTDVDAKNNDEWTALHVAAGEGQKEITELLIAKGADVNANTPDGLTVFFAAILGANKEIIELLIAKGADVNVRGFGGMTPLNMADDEGEKEIADLLRKHGAKTSDWLKAGESIHIAAKAGHIEAIKKHLAAGADVNAKSGPFGLTPLHFATWRSNKETMEFLIDNGADVNAKRNDGAIALHYAVWFGLKGKTEFLLSKGSDVKARDGDNDGATPLHEAVMRSPNNGIIELLVANEADVNDMDDSGKTPLDWAIKYKRNKTADLLRDHGGKTGQELKAEGK